MKVKTKEFKYDLTIGMIFRDDIKYIRKCLESMMPLREALNCQLIMTDTGSVDGSRDVAEEYADILLDFEWCDDFAAARNTAVELAEGRWFMFMDCDEEFSDGGLEAAEFIKSKQSRSFDHCRFPMRSYEEFENFSAYESGNVLRFFNFQEGRRNFSGRIHEYIAVGEKSYSFQSLLHHWGYTKDVKAGKIARNRPFMEKEIEDNPGNLHIHEQNIVETSDPNLREIRILNALEHSRKDLSPRGIKFHYIFCIYYHMVSVRLKNFEICDTLEKEISELDVAIHDGTYVQLEYYFSLLNRSCVQEKFSEIYGRYKNYHTLYQKLWLNPDKSSAGLFHPISCFPDRYYPCILHTIRSLTLSSEEQHEDNAREILINCNAYEHSTEKGKHPFLKSFVPLVYDLKAYSLLPKVYQFLLEDESESELEELESLIDMSLFHHKNKENTKEILASMGDNVIDSFTAILSLMKNQFSPQAFTEDVFKFITEEEDYHLKPLNAYLFYGYLLTGQDPLGYVEKNNISTLITYIRNLVEKFPDILTLIENNFNDDQFTISTIKEEKLWAYLGMRGTLYLSEELKQQNEEDEKGKREAKFSVDVEQINQIYSKAITLMYNYVNKVYNPYLLSEVGKGILPPEELYSIYGMEAMKAENPLEMVRKLKEGMSFCPSYAPIISIFLAEITNLDENPVQTSDKKEASDLSQQIKSTIKTLLEKGDKDQATTFLEKYKVINPDDPEIPELMKKLEE